MFKGKKKIIIALIIPTLFFGVASVYAIFRNGITGNGNIELAQWRVEALSNDSTLNLVSGVTNQVYTLTVENISETDIDYSIVISGLPEGVKIKLDDSLTFEAPTDGVITFSKPTMEILYSAAVKQKTHTLEFKSEAGTLEAANDEIDIDVIAKQKL